jgi:hypothetical protein
MSAASARVIIGLSAVAVTAGPDGQMQVLVTGRGGADALPFGSFDPDGHRTFELAVRDFVTAQTGLALGWVEQLYTFGDKGREAPLADTGAGMALTDRVVSVGYLALVPEAAPPARADARWQGWARYFPWEDRRPSSGGPAALESLRPGLAHWIEAGGPPDQHGLRAARVASAFGLAGEVANATAPGWQDSRVLDRYELLYEAGLVHEAGRDRARARAPGIAAGGALVADTAPPLPVQDAIANDHRISGHPMASDHRRILATAIGRLRAKVRYRPIALDLMGAAFTLSDLQDRVEAICGLALHKQNFRRSAQASGLVLATGTLRAGGPGRPAELFQRTPHSRSLAAEGLHVPVLRG